MNEEGTIHTVAVQVSKKEMIIESVRMITDEDPRLIATVCVFTAIAAPIVTFVFIAAENYITGTAGRNVALRKILEMNKNYVHEE